MGDGDSVMTRGDVMFNSLKVGKSKDMFRELEEMQTFWREVHKPCTDTKCSSNPGCSCAAH